MTKKTSSSKNFKDPNPPELRVIVEERNKSSNRYTFKKNFKLTSVDISEPMLKIAQELNPEVTYQYGDMRTIRLRENFDAVTILDSISYMRTANDLKRTFATAFYHLKPGGVFLTIAEKTAGQLEKSESFVSTYSRGNIEITFLENYYDPDPSDTSFEATFIYLVRVNGQLEIHTDPHICGIFKLETWHELLKETGFKVIQKSFTEVAGDRSETFPVFICTKPML